MRMFRLTAESRSLGHFTHLLCAAPSLRNLALGAACGNAELPGATWVDITWCAYSTAVFDLDDNFAVSGRYNRGFPIYILRVGNLQCS